MKKSVLEIKIEKIDNDYSVFKIIKFNDSILKKDIKIIKDDILFSINEDRTEFYYNLVKDRPVLNINYKEKIETLYTIENKHIDYIKKIITEVNKKYGIRWRGERTDCYYAVSGKGKVVKLLEESEYSDETYYNIGNYFQTEEEAIIARNKILDFWEKIKTEEI
ncbi:hypothetical protein [Fusobacterium periodonticum]|uniref:Uncharacterized protein n=1 Tax=Fusobacterium periodonticum ATCC 33693 TaxID=546275 RepID=D4CXD0_9FUSO|nr:hypothetical protein [Fusobacterium periodonticum]EFE86050.1 hypothetical protein FUSPEROL_02091 [Fusobacterium periodonticum ATCC 33693]